VAVALAEVGQRGPRREERPVDVGRHHRPVLPGGHLGDVTAAGEARVDHQDVQTAEGSDRRLDQRVDCGVVADVRRDAARVDTVARLQVLGDRLEAFLPACRQDDVRPFACQGVCGCLADARTRAGHDRGSAVEGRLHI
jgi:hypothetical protein